MLHNEDLQPLLESKASVYGSNGDKIGTLAQIYLDEGTDMPQFATVKTGLYGTAESFVPLNDAGISHGQLYVKFTKLFVTHAPNIDPSGELSLEDENQLYEYYSQAGLGAEKNGLHQDLATSADPADEEPATAQHPGTNLDTSTGPRMRKFVGTEHPQGSSRPDPRTAKGGKATPEDADAGQQINGPPMDP